MRSILSLPGPLRRALPDGVRVRRRRLREDGGGAGGADAADAAVATMDKQNEQMHVNRRTHKVYVALMMMMPAVMSKGSLPT